MILLTPFLFEKQLLEFENVGLEERGNRSTLRKPFEARIGTKNKHSPHETRPRWEFFYMYLYSTTLTLLSRLFCQLEGVIDSYTYTFLFD